MRWLAPLGLAVLTALTGCVVPYDDDGEATALAAPKQPYLDAVPVIVDTDAGGDDLAALAFLMRHPDVDVRAVTIAATGAVSCEAGVRVVTGLIVAILESRVPIACGREKAGPGARRFPSDWREVSEWGSGIQLVQGNACPCRPRT